MVIIIKNEYRKFREIEMARGGYRPGSGPAKGTRYKPRKKKAKQKAPTRDIPEEVGSGTAENLDPLAYMLRVMNDPKADRDRRDRMAIAAAPFIHPRANGKGKKETREERARAAGSGKFKPSSPPNLKLIK